MPGSDSRVIVKGVAVCAGGCGVWEKPALDSAHSCRYTLSWSPQASATSLARPKFSA